MFPGRLMKIQIIWHGNSPEAVMDRLPTANIISSEKNRYLIDAEVYGEGILMWILSQGNKIEIIEPQSLRDEIKKILQDILKMY